MTLVFLLPLFLSLFCMIWLISLMIQKKQSINGICHRELIQLQKHLADFQQQLFKLNPRAESLQLQRMEAEIEKAAIIATGHLELLPIAEKRIKLIQLQQNMLRFQQKSILLMARQKRYQTSIKLPTQLPQGISTRVTHSSSDLAVEFIPQGSDSPIAKEVANFEKQQRTTLSWKAPLFNLAKSKWPFLQFNEHHAIRWESACAVSLKSQGGWQWTPTLVVANP